MLICFSHKKESSSVSWERGRRRESCKCKIISHAWLFWWFDSLSNLSLAPLPLGPSINKLGGGAPFPKSSYSPMLIPLSVVCCYDASVDQETEVLLYCSSMRKRVPPKDVSVWKLSLIVDHVGIDCVSTSLACCPSLSAGIFIGEGECWCQCKGRVWFCCFDWL